MSGDTTPEPFAVVWSPQARADLRAIDRTNALEILHCIDRYRVTAGGDVKKLKPPLTGFRLRCGDYRIFFDLQSEHQVNVVAVKHRREAYR